MAQPFPNQVQQQTQAYATGKNLAMMAGEVLQWNPDVPQPMAMTFINNAYRRVLDEKLWYGQMVNGQITVPQVYTVGTCTVTNGSPTVQLQGGAAVTAAMAGRNFRPGMTFGWQRIASVNAQLNQLTLEMPWGYRSMNQVGYQIAQVWISLPGNVKFILEMVNQSYGYRLVPNLPQPVLDEYDTWRASVGFTFAFANRNPDANGNPVIELYPAPIFQQAFPYIAYIQPPDMKGDQDFPVSWIRSDVLVCSAIKDALLWRGPKLNRFYDADTAAIKEREFQAEIGKMRQMDDNLYMKDLVWNYKSYPFSQYGAQFLQSHPGVWGELA